MRRRCVVAAAAGLVVVASGIAASPSATARDTAGAASTVTSGASGRATALGECGSSASMSGTDTLVETPMDGKLRTHLLSREGVADLVAVRASGWVRVRAARTPWGVRRMELSAGLATSASPTASHSCPVLVDAVGGVDGPVRVPKRSWLVAVRTEAGGTDSSQSTVTDSHGTTRQLDGPGARTWLVPPGDYVVGVGSMSRIHLAAADGPTEHEVSTRASTAFIPVGTRRSLTGTGTGLVSVGHRDCSRNRVVASFSAAARTRLRSATFVVDGQRRVVLRGRQLQRSSLVLGSIARKGAGRVSVRMVLRNGSGRTTASTSWPCA